MTENNVPSTEELWRIVQEERAQRGQLEREITQLRAHVERNRAGKGHRSETGVQRDEEQNRKLSRAKLLGAAGLAGVALAGTQATSAFAQTPPPIPSFTTLRSGYRVFGQLVNYNQVVSGIDATAGGQSGVPTGASSLYAAVMTFTNGALTLWADGDPEPPAGNWGGTTTGQLNLLYMMIPLSTAGKFQLHQYLAADAYVYVDAWGYLY